MLAFILLKPASLVLTPRALHSFNVFLIRLTSLPQLIIIGVYERHFAAGKKLRETSKDAAQSLFNSLPRHIKNMPLVEALVGSASNDLLDAIFDVELDDNDYEIFDDSDVDMDAPALRSRHSRENMLPTPTKNKSTGRKPLKSMSPIPRIRTRRPTSRGRLSSDRQRGESSSAQNSPRLQSLRLSNLSSNDVVNSPEPVTASTTSNRSPLAKFFGSRYLSPTAGGMSPEAAHVAQQASLAATSADATLRRIESLLDSSYEMPVQKLKDEMRELQVRFCMNHVLDRP